MSGRPDPDSELYDRIFRELNPDGAVSEYEDILEKMEEVKRDLNSNSAEFVKRIVTIMAKASNAKRKSKEVQRLIRDD